MNVPAEPEVSKFHLSLNVSSLETAIAYYRTLFGIDPAKCHADYAKFELEDPPVVFSLAPRPPSQGGSLSHLGFRVGSRDAVTAFSERLNAAGICTEDQNGTVCSFARKDKIWTRDPDGNFWEVYWVEEEVDPVVVRRSLEGVAAQATTPTEAPRIWEHSLVNADAIPAPYADASLDEVWLTGTFNAGSDAAHIDAVLAEAKRVLKPGGKVTVHGLVSDAPLTTQPKLPGLASMVAFVPARPIVYEQLSRAGFVNLHATKLTEKPWFTHENIGLREMKFAAWKQPEAANEADRMVLYKGPFAQVRIEGARVFHRGERTTVPASVWHQLRHGPSAEQFLFFEPSEAACSR